MARWVSVWLASLLCLVGLFSPCHAGGPHVLIETDRGKLTLELYPDAAPRTVTRFVELVKKGFYNGLTFHRVVPKFLIPGGDPAGDGTGGSGLRSPAAVGEEKASTGTVGIARLVVP